MSGREASTELIALLGQGARFEGKLVFEGRVRIDGHFKGEIAGEGTLVLGPCAEVEADVAVDTLIVLGGTLRGHVRARRTVELHAPARVFGNISAPELVIDRGVSFEGQSRVAGEADPPERDGADALQDARDTESGNEAP